MAKNFKLHWGLSAIILTTNLALFSVPARADNSEQGTDNDLAELQRQEAQLKANIDKLNKSNPNFVPPADPAAPSLIGEIKPDATVENLSKVINNPAVQGYMKIFSNPALIGQLEQVIKSPNRQLVFFVEVVGFIMFLMFHAWCAAKITHWFLSFTIRLVSSLSYFAISTVAIPWFFIGDPYARMVTTLAQSVTELIKL